MPSAANYIGPLLLPVPAGAQDAALDDATLTGLLAYLGHWLSASLDAKLAAQRGETNSSTAGACPSANRFPWDPSTYFVRGDEHGSATAIYFPSLYAWHIGRPRRVPYSTVKTMKAQSIGVAYIFDELTLPGGWEARSGLLGAVDAAFWSAAEQCYHPSFGLNSEPDGTPYAVSAKLAGPGLVYDGGECMVMSPVPGQTRTFGAGADGHVLRGYPTLKAQFTVHELVGQFIATDPADVAGEMTLTIKANADGGVDDAVEIMQRVLPAPDGTETL